ncbi:MAG TPA: methyltransferase [Caulobacteraceae bacterium]|jgi:S-adenosylmethionine-dependent methyltransferase|nr:methyltransferase [Caulobacteraceae bacterium]
MAEPPGDLFGQRMEQWRALRAMPWTQLRFLIVAHTLGKTIAALGGGSWRILDVGGGDGGDALPLALAGHSVTVLDPSAPMLEKLAEDAAGAGASDRVVGVRGDIGSMAGLDLNGFDLVLCHFVLQYLDDLDGPLAQLLEAVRPGGRLSLIAPNRPGEVLAKAARGVDPAAAFALLDTETNRTVTFDHTVRRIDAETAVEALERAGCAVTARFGGRCINDLLPDSAPKGDPTFFADLLRLELAVCDREPYLRTGFFWQLVARKP